MDSTPAREKDGESGVESVQLDLRVWMHDGVSIVEAVAIIEGKADHHVDTTRESITVVRNVVVIVMLICARFDPIGCPEYECRVEEYEHEE